MITRVIFVLIAACSTLGADAAKIVLLAGRASHAPGTHEFNAGMLLLKKCLAQNKGVHPIVVPNGWPTDEAVFDGARSIVMYMDGGRGHPIKEGNRLELVSNLMREGVGLAALHFAVQVPKENGGPQFLDWLGGYYERFYSKNPVNDLLLTQATREHPISRGWKSFQAKDEWYYRIRFRSDDDRLTPILTTTIPEEGPGSETVAWSVERADGGRGFGFTGGHFHANWGNPDFRQLVVNAILWTAKVDIPPTGAQCAITAEDLEQNLDPKPPPKRR